MPHWSDVIKPRNDWFRCQGRVNKSQCSSFIRNTQARKVLDCGLNISTRRQLQNQPGVCVCAEDVTQEDVPALSSSVCLTTVSVSLQVSQTAAARSRRRCQSPQRGRESGTHRSGSQISALASCILLRFLYPSRPLSWSGSCLLTVSSIPVFYTPHVWNKLPEKLEVCFSFFIFQRLFKLSLNPRLSFLSTLINADINAFQVSIDAFDENYNSTCGHPEVEAVI